MNKEARITQVFGEESKSLLGQNGCNPHYFIALGCKPSATEALRQTSCTIYAFALWRSGHTLV